MKTSAQETKRPVVTSYSVVALLILLAFVLSSCSGHGHDERTVTVNEINQLESAIEAYRAEYGVMPDASSDAKLVKEMSGDNPRKIEFIAFKSWQLSSKGEVLDAWGTPIQVWFQPAAHLQIKSAGEDKVFGTPDDIAVF